MAALAFGGLKALLAGRFGSLNSSRKDDEWFRLIAEKTSDLVCLHEPDGRYLYISPSCRRLLGYEPEDLLGTDPYDLFHPEDLERIRSEAHEKALEAQEAISITYRIRKESGEYTWFETLTEPIIGESGAVVRLQTASRDVSERKRAEEALAEAARARAEFRAEVSHELRTPLTVIRGNAEVGLELGGDCEHEEALREILRESSTMSRMVEDLLFLARSESAAPPFRMEPLEVEVLLAGLERRAGALAAEHDATLSTSFEENGLVRVDPVRVEQAILVLVDNAVKYGPEGAERDPQIRRRPRGAARRRRGSRSRLTGDGTPARLRPLLPAARGRGARQRPRPLDSADHSRSPRRTHRGREPARRRNAHVFHPPLAAGTESGKLPEPSARTKKLKADC
jgi:PAS domain S-box-containing protein